MGKAMGKRHFVAVDASGLIRILRDFDGSIMYNGGSPTFRAASAGRLDEDGDSFQADSGSPGAGPLLAAQISGY